MGVEGLPLAGSLLSQVLEPFCSILQLVREAQLPFLPPCLSLGLLTPLQWLIVLLRVRQSCWTPPSPLSFFDGCGTIMDPFVIHFSGDSVALELKGSGGLGESGRGALTAP